jgi:hypothetical protein
MLVRLTFNPASANISSGSMTTTEAVLRISGYEESDSQKKLILSKINLPKNLFYYAPQRHVETQTLASSSTYTIRLSGIHGMCNQLFFVLRSTANIGSPSNEFSFARVSTFEILDESGVSQTRFSPIDTSDMIMQYAHQYVENNQKDFMSHCRICHKTKPPSQMKRYYNPERNTYLGMKRYTEYTRICNTCYTSTVCDCGSDTDCLDERTTNETRHYVTTREW